MNHCFTRDKGRNPISSRRDRAPPPCLETRKPKTERQRVLSTRCKAMLVKHLLVFKDLLMAPSQLLSSWVIKEKLHFPKPGSFPSCRQTLPLKWVCSKIAAGLFLTSNCLAGLRQCPQHCMDCSLRPRLQQVSGSCLVKIKYYQNALFSCPLLPSPNGLSRHFALHSMTGTFPS